MKMNKNMYNKPLDKLSKTPLYKQLYTQLKNMIINEEIKPGETFYSENQLLKIYDVSRITIRSALKMLEDEGYLYKSQGKESIVIDQNKYTWNLHDLTDDLRRLKEELITQVKAIDKIIPSEKVLKKLNLNNETKFVFRIERLRIVRDINIARSISYLPPFLPLDINSIKINDSFSITDFLREIGESPFYAEETLEAINADNETCQFLQIPNNTAVFLRERITYNQEDKPLEYVVSYYNAKNTKYYIKNKLM